MDAFAAALYADPYLSIAYFFAFCGALALILFVAGFSAGFRGAITMEGHAEHMHHYRARTVWGVLLLFLLFTAWEIVRFVAGYLMGTTGPSGTFIVGLLVVWLILYALYYFGPSGVAK